MNEPDCFKPNIDYPHMINSQLKRIADLEARLAIAIEALENLRTDWYFDPAITKRMNVALKQIEDRG